MALSVDYVNPSDLKGYSANARIHSSEQIQQIVHSIEEFGFTNPILVTTSLEIIAGHGRLAAASELRLEAVPVIKLAGLSDKQIKALRIADNQLALNATWDLDLLAAEVSGLEYEGFEIDVLGFDDDFIAGLLPDDESPSMPVDQQDQQELGEADESVDMVLGPYKLKVKRSQFDSWETGLRAKAGFDPQDVVAEIKKRLGLKG